MYQKAVIPDMNPGSRSFNKSCKPQDMLDSRFTMRCPGMTKRGFTLIELLVVVLIIGILSSVALPQYTKAVEKSRATQGMVLVNSLVTAQKVYYMANGKYAAGFDELDIDLPGNPVGASAVIKDFDIRMDEMNNSSLAHIQAMYNRQEWGRNWYILFYFSRDKLYCVAHTGSEAGNRLCKSFSLQPENCPEGGFLCYPV